MNLKSLTCTVALAVSSITFLGCASGGKQTAKDPQAGGAPEMKLPPGWTEADAQACMAAATPGPQHERILKEVGTWKGKNTMWMYPGAEPVTSEAQCKISNFLDGRYARIDWSGDMPGMGPYKGFGLTGFDNIEQKYVSLWIDNMSTGLMDGTGELSADGNTMTWRYDYICPITKKASVFRQVEKVTGPKSKTLEMYGPDPKTGVEYKLMVIELTKQ